MNILKISVLLCCVLLVSCYSGYITFHWNSVNCLIRILSACWLAKVGGALCSQVCLDLLGNVNLGITVTMPPPLPHPPQSQEEGTNAPLAHIVHWAAQHPLFVHLASTVLWRRQRHLKATARLDSTAQGSATTATPTDGTTGNICPKGSYCPAGSVNFTKCPPGTFSNTQQNTNISSCLDCTQGKYCEGYGFF